MITIQLDAGDLPAIARLLSALFARAIEAGAPSAIDDLSVDDAAFDRAQAALLERCREEARARDDAEQRTAASYQRAVKAEAERDAAVARAAELEAALDRWERNAAPQVALTPAAIVEAAESLLAVAPTTSEPAEVAGDENESPCESVGHVEWPHTARPEWLELIASGIEGGVSLAELLATPEVLDAIVAAAPCEVSAREMGEVCNRTTPTAIGGLFGVLHRGLAPHGIELRKVVVGRWALSVEPARRASSPAERLAGFIGSRGGQHAAAMDVWSTVLGVPLTDVLSVLRETARELGYTAQRTPAGLYAVRVGAGAAA